MLVMVVENFKDANPKPIYERLKLKGRMMPEGLVYINSWISEDFKTCWQVMESDDLSKLDQWISEWEDLMEFEVIPVMTSAEARLRSEVDG